MNYKLRSIINDLAQSVIDVYGFCIPNDEMESIVTKLGGKLQADNTLFCSSDGSVCPSGTDSFLITYSTNVSAERQRFTIAHELGHLFLHLGFKTNEDLWKNQSQKSMYRLGDSELEYQANEFAAAFLMPEKAYYDQLVRHSNGNMVDISGVAEYFRVSVSAASTRGKFLGYLEW